MSKHQAVGGSMPQQSSHLLYRIYSFFSYPLNVASQTAACSSSPILPTPSSGCSSNVKLLSEPLSHTHAHTVLFKQSPLIWLSAGSVCSASIFHLFGELHLRPRVSAGSYNAWQAANAQHTMHSLALLALSFYPIPYYHEETPSSHSSTSCHLPSCSSIFFSHLQKRTASTFDVACQQVATGRCLVLIGLPLMCGCLYWLSLTEVYRSKSPLCGYWGGGWRLMDCSLMVAGAIGMIMVGIGWGVTIWGLLNI
eukprot:GHVS01064321.1.p1 GENE.GHVS01064321.1~~GHVS01064321.1.p1  ORF type:complete len:252 (+),score=35.41 GHVS01064321.1:440-1195(+)